MTLTAPAWNGATGGLLTFLANGAVTLAGVVDMGGKGFRGADHSGACFPGPLPNRYPACAYSNGFYGESASGVAERGGAMVGEVVMKTEYTPLLQAALAKGCGVQVGTDMLFEMIPAYLEFFGYGTATADELRAVAQIKY